MNTQHVFIIGSKGIPAQYGGFETFVEHLTRFRKSPAIRYHVACMADHNENVIYNDAHCFHVKVPDIGSAKAVYYDVAALQRSIRYCEKHGIKRPVFYVLACRIGPFIGRFTKRIRALDGVLYVNPDGHEWLRGKWSAPVRRYWKVSEGGMVRHADLLICDSRNIEAYIRKEYQKYRPETTFIAYGAETRPSALSDEDPAFLAWLDERGLKKGGYYLIVGRFVPENNFETMIREFMASGSDKKLCIITTMNPEFRSMLEEKLHLGKDPRVVFAGTVYDQELLKKIREQAYGYLHGHEVGGTNPSLLEALGSTDVNLLLDVGFNREVGEDAALYWTKEQGSLQELLEKADSLSTDERKKYGEFAKDRIHKEYSWEKIAEEYESLFLSRRAGSQTADNG